MTRGTRMAMVASAIISLLIVGLVVFGVLPTYMIWVWLAALVLIPMMPLTRGRSPNRRDRD